jgi:hypothetical protein
VGLGLLLLCAAPKADYIVFRSLPKPSNEGEATPGESGKPTPRGIDNLLANCEQNRRLLKQIKLRIYGLKDGRLHDRYILIMAPDGLPVAGFNLSNSLQTVAENFPLLITPIPADVLLEVERYKRGLVQEAVAAQRDSETANTSMRLLFDSMALPTAPRRYEPLRFLEKANAGDALSIWTGEPSLQGLSGDPLKELMAALGLLKGDTLALPETASLRNCLDQQTVDFAGFTASWEVLGDLLAHSHVADQGFRELESQRNFLDFLARFLEASFNRAHDEVGELAVVGARFFREPFETLLHSSYHPHHFFHPTKYAILTWAEFFAIKLLWLHAPDTLLAIAEAQMTSVPMEPQGPDAVRLSLLSQIVSEISLSMQFAISEVQRDRLIRSSNGLLQWIGLNAIERQLEEPGGLAAVLRLVATFAYSEQVSALGWMVHRAARNPKTSEIYNGLVAALHGALPTSIPAEELRDLVDSMRGHMRELAWAGPWLFQDVVSPLLQSGRANCDDACEIWVQELGTLLEPGPKQQTWLFDRAREGQTTNIAAFLFAYSGPDRQQASLQSMKKILKPQRRIVQQPLASTSDWTRWNVALVVSMWVLIFTRWGQYYLRARNITNCELEELSIDAGKLAMVRPMNEWRSMSTGKPGELAAFLDQVEELLAPNDESKSESQ